MVFSFDEAPEWFTNYFLNSLEFNEFHATIVYEGSHDFVKDRAIVYFQSDMYKLYIYKDKIFVVLDANDPFWLHQILRG